MAARPFPCRIVPNRLKERLYYRHYHTRHSKWPQLFESARLALCPTVSMYNLVPGDVISGNIAFNGFYEWGLSQRIADLAQHGSTLVDVGANMGYFSLLWAGLNPSGNVISVEASPRNVGIIQQNVKQNGFDGRIQLIPKAAGDRAGTIEFDAGPESQTGWGGIAAQATATSIKVPIVRLDEELGDREIDVLKVDVEGADTWVLLGCEELLKQRRIGTIFFEQNVPRMQNLGIDPKLAVTFLEDHGYRCRQAGDEDEWMAAVG
jgi:FkbM family methyltransferase